jgi:hypothetical protein
MMEMEIGEGEDGMMMGEDEKFLFYGGSPLVSRSLGPWSHFLFFGRSARRVTWRQ